MVSQELWNRVQQYAAGHEIDIDKLRPLGYGNDGNVWKYESWAIKAFHHQWNYRQEKLSYQRLTERSIREICGLQLPLFEDYDDNLLIVQIGIVTPPFLLDFGKVYFDTPPDYPEEPAEDRDAYLREMFEDDAPAVKRVLRAIQIHGIYYVDPNPGNIKFRPDPP